MGHEKKNQITCFCVIPNYQDNIVVKSQTRVVTEIIRYHTKIRCKNKPDFGVSLCKV